MLDTACRVFSRSSYRGATTAEIAREAGISEPILYRHFGSKRDLYLACLDEAWRSFREVCGAGDRRAIPSRCLGAIADAYMAKRARIRMVDLWIQALTEASEDAVIAAGAAQAGARGARLLRRRDPRRPARAASSTPTAIRSPKRGSSSPAACSRRWTTGSAACSATTCSACAPSAGAGCSAPRSGRHKPSPDARKPRLRHPGLSLVRRGAGWATPSLGPAARPAAQSCRLWRSPCTRPERRPSVQGALTVRAMSRSVK